MKRSDLTSVVELLAGLLARAGSRPFPILRNSMGEPSQTTIVVAIMYKKTGCTKAALKNLGRIR